VGCERVQRITHHWPGHVVDHQARWPLVAGAVVGPLFARCRVTTGVRGIVLSVTRATDVGLEVLVSSGMGNRIGIRYGWVVHTAVKRLGTCEWTAGRVGA